MNDKLSPSKRPESAQVLICGPLKLQNELMAWFLQQTSGLTCAEISTSELDRLLNKKHGHACLIMLDCQGSSPAALWSRIRNISEADSDRLMTALFNVASDQEIRNELVNCGVRGVFFNDDPLANLSKGINAILNGELWFSRELLVKCIFESKENSDETEPANLATDALGTFLTLREKEILVMIASGVSNRKIASFLGISTNTVKTHIYNIYGKIKVPNRLQAALWAAKHL
jgi:DNA-binding NarL/FixJ family response regulator